MKKNEVNELLDRLQREWPITEILSFNELNLSDKIQIWPFELIRFGDQFIREKSRLQEIQEVKDKVVGKEYDILKFHSDKALTKQEIEQYYLPNNPNVIKVNKVMEKQEVVVAYFENCLKALEKIQWNAKLYMDDRKYSG
jgi:hypothetical protein